MILQHRPCVGKYETFEKSTFSEEICKNSNLLDLQRR